jgi:predicted esterase
MNAETMLKLSQLLFQEPPILASLEAPNVHFLAEPRHGEAPSGFNWGTHATTEFHVDVHHRILLTLLPELWREFNAGPSRTILMGFSQPVGLNYRFAGTHPGHVRGVLGLCGGVPKNWEEGPYHPVDASILHISRDEDPFFPAERALHFGERLRTRAKDVEFHMLPGPHRFPSKAAPLVQAWLNRILAV